MGGSSSKCPPSYEVRITGGKIVGRRFFHDEEKPVDAYQGVPFAKPPVGELRFRKPEPVDAWEGVKQCIAFGNRGMQTTNMYVKWKHGPVSEDCLYLNVFAPAWKAPSPSGFPVMVFIHGGAFVSDSTVKYGDELICKYLVRKGVIVVTTQYRLGFLGFWSTGDSSCVDNLGLWDQTRALEWVRDNIAAFGGDAHNVTIMGQSAGGVCVDMLSLSPHSRDLFHKVIPMAGNASADWAMQDNAVEKCRQWAKDKMCIETGDKFIDRLREQPAHKFATSMDVKIKKSIDEIVPIGPRIDGVFFPKSLSELRKEAEKKPRMVGCCRYEGLMFVVANWVKKEPSSFESIIAYLIPETVPEFRKKRDEMLQEYMKEDNMAKGLAELYSDLFLNIACQQYVLDWIEAGQDDIYFYSFDYFNDNSLGPLSYLVPIKGSVHCSEIPFILGKGILWDFTLTEQDIEMLQKVTGAWANFAKFGNPNGDNGENPLGIEWQPATSDCPQRCMRIDAESRMDDQFRDGRAMLWIENRK